VNDLNLRRTPAHRRLAFDELLVFAGGLERRRTVRSGLRAPGLRPLEGADTVAARLLPFELTGAQRRVVREIERDMGSGAPMARLIQGDVGSGKTAVAAVAMEMTAGAGYQAALMAPTELLAEQHAKTLQGLFESTPHGVALLTSSMASGDQREVRIALEEGSARIVVGTHSLFQTAVRFSKLGLAIIDEQHRFGVGHRQALVSKGASPHVLVMTATPIPRSLALTIYGDLDVSLIDELPPGRRSVKTVTRGEEARPALMDFVRREVSDGGRAYFVYPMISSGDEIPGPALEDSLDDVRSALGDVDIGVLHGRMSRDERDSAARDFATGAIQVLLATTVIEVGVDVPQATVMVIESADRFGLSQLHQLRGRVGRGPRQAWCVLMTGPEISDDAGTRLDVVCRTTDGFEIAEADLELRGPGELTGTRQWGPAAFRFADLIRHAALLDAARRTAGDLEKDGLLEKIRTVLGCYHPMSDDVPTG
jgi:ATP-dependent DNA helicase RecG